MIMKKIKIIFKILHQNNLKHMINILMIRMNNKKIHHLFILLKINMLMKINGDLLEMLLYKKNQVINGKIVMLIKNIIIFKMHIIKLLKY